MRIVRKPDSAGTSIKECLLFLSLKKKKKCKIDSVEKSSCLKNCPVF